MARANHTDELCDPCALTHDFPAVTGFEMAMIGTRREDAMTYLMHAAHERGAIITMSFHMPNLATGNGTDHVWWDDGNIFHSVKKILPGGDHHHQFLSNLDAVAAWSKARLDSRGRLIPILLRLWHEADGDWFWWGLNNDAHNTIDEIKQLFRLTVTYLRDQKGVRNFLYAFTPDCGGTDVDMDLYPGDDVVDILGTDCYLQPERDGPFLKRALEKTVRNAEARGKIPILAETGVAPATDLFNRTTFFTKDLIYPFISTTTTTTNITTSGSDDNSSARVAYLLTWKNECWGNTGTEIDYYYYYYYYY
nr:hypothetical protein BaRGS_000455 [Batillaria attramentaria]